ncbi:hypothetical protein ACRRTK_017312 [Alexandromys fortis]
MTLRSRRGLFLFLPWLRPPRRCLCIAKRGPLTSHWASPALGGGAAHCSCRSWSGTPFFPELRATFPAPGAKVARGPWPPQVGEPRARLSASRL